MTLISVYNSDGCVGRCDAKCYDASSPACTCDCICGGANHGVGQNKAESNTREYCDKWIETYMQNKRIENGTSEVNPNLFQLKMF